MTMSGNQLISLFLYVTRGKFWLPGAQPFLSAGFGPSVTQYFNNMDKEAIKKNVFVDKVEGYGSFSVLISFNIIILR